MKMTKKQFRIGELAKRLQVERFVIRFWEKEFDLSASRSSGKQRFYTEEDYVLFSSIKQLLYNEKFTISGAKKQLELEKKSKAPITCSAESSEQSPAPTGLYNTETHDLTHQMIQLRKKLIKLQELL